MFEEMVVSTSTNKKTNKPWTVCHFPWSSRVLFPRDSDFDSSDLLRKRLPKTLMVFDFLLATASATSARHLHRRPWQVIHKPVQHLMDAGKLVQPKAIPKDLKTIKEEPEPRHGRNGWRCSTAAFAGGSAGRLCWWFVIGGAGGAPATLPRSRPKRRVNRWW